MDIDLYWLVQGFFHPSTFCYHQFSLEIEFKVQLGVWRKEGGRGCCKLWLKQHSNPLKPLQMALFGAVISGIVNVLLHLISKFFPFLDFTFTLEQSFC